MSRTLSRPHSALTNLFGEVEAPAVARLPPAPAEPRPAGPFAAVALEQSIDRMLDYAAPPHLVPTIQPGQRVRVPLGKRNRPATGYVVGVHPTSEYPRIKTLFDIED